MTMIVHDHSEAISRITMTVLTIGSARRNTETTDSPPGASKPLPPAGAISTLVGAARSCASAGAPVGAASGARCAKAGAANISVRAASAATSVR
ncbi:MAG: hypothetical protein WDM81_11305 [Rhizomicrobium sp.]